MNPNEKSKTLWFLGVAVVVVAVAWFTRPVTAVKNEAEVLGSKLFPEFTKASDVDNLQVLQHDKAKGESSVLEIAKQNGLFVVPSHSNYPADAKDHLAAAATSLIDVTILGLAPGFDAGSPPLDEASLRKKYNQYGVVDPDPKTVKGIDEGVGTRVTMSGGGRQLASAIIGNSLPEQIDQYYLRITGKEPVYIVKLDASKLSTKFDEWIEPNLLNLNTLDLKKVEIKDYSVTPMLDPQSQGLVLMSSPKGEFVLDTPSGDQPWKLSQELTFDPAKKSMVPHAMAADEEVNVSTLDALKTELEGLKIVDVEKKPSAVPADLRVRKIDDDARETLAERGFFAVGNPKDRNAPLEVLSNSGDITLQMADGVRYVLRFGVTTGESSAAEKAKKKGGAKSPIDEKPKDEGSPGMDRYLFVTADFNQDSIPKPVFDKMPEEKPAEKKADPKDAKPGDSAKKDEAKKAEPAKSGEAKKVEPKKDEPNKAEPAKASDVKKDEPKKDENKGEPKKEEPGKGGETKKDEPKKDDAKPAEPAKEAPTPEALAAQKKQIETDNKRKQEEYDSKIVAGKKHAKELGDRFAKWYYVIPGSTYAKIHLDRKDIVKKKEPPKDSTNKDGANKDHDHGTDSLPTSPAGTLEQLKKDAPAADKK